MCWRETDEPDIRILSSLHSGTLDKEEFVRMMYEFIQNREPASTEEEEEDDTDQPKPPGPEDDGTYPPTDGVVSVSVISCADLLAADSNGLSDPYIKLKMGANGNERKIKQGQWESDGSPAKIKRTNRTQM